MDVGEGDGAVRWHQRVALGGVEGPGVALLGFASEAGVLRNQGRPGAAEGPTALRRALAGLAWQGSLPVGDAGDVVVRGDALEEGQTALGERVAALLRQGRLPLVLGGGHETAFGVVQGLVARLQETHLDTTPVLGVLNLDAHLDVRRGHRPSSGTPFRDMALLCSALGWGFRYLCLGVAEPSNTRALFDSARELGARWVPDHQVRMDTLPRIRSLLDEALGEADHLHLSVDLDVLPGWVAPGVSAPAAVGAEPAAVEALVAETAQDPRLRTVEISELSPPHDPDGRTARVAARLVWRLVSSLGGGDRGE